jgi:hypothetical protein
MVSEKPLFSGVQVSTTRPDGKTVDHGVVDVVVGAGASEMVERVAKVLRKERGCDAPGFPCSFCQWTEDANDEVGCITLARAAIAAMREPTQRMILVPALIEHGKPWSYYWSDQFDQGLASRAKWQAMIDEALK